MDPSLKVQNDKLMKVGYLILQECKKKSLPCFLWGGGAIYHMLGGKLDYRIMSDIEFFLPKAADKSIQEILEKLGFIPYKTFNNIQNMYSNPRREFYRPSRELTDSEIEDIMHGRRKNVKDVEFQKVELFIDGIRMCWLFKIEDLPKNYFDSLICPPGFQIALKVNPIHPDDFDFKDIQDISSVLNKSGCEIKEFDSIFIEPQVTEDINFSIGTNFLEKIAKDKYEFPTTAVRNLKEVLNYSGLTEDGKSKVQQLIDYLSPFISIDQGSRLKNIKREKPVRVDARTR
ncbi:MAG: hypothetical protein EAX86_04075 [Candidatus Heimdallarchaeota archaeon]|nr:hypothetical protein [Candidatus Heimdallarchaeota archaeon]